MKNLSYNLNYILVLVLFVGISACTSTEQEQTTSSDDLITEELRDSMTPDEVLEAFKEGNQRFLDGNLRVRKFTTEVAATSKSQNPYAVVLSCIDSRVPVETIFDKRFGEIFSTRLAGNVVNEDVLGGMEFATALSGAKLVVVMGHTSCGAIKGAINNAEYGNLTALVNKIKPAENIAVEKMDPVLDPSSDMYIDNVAREHVELAISQIKEQSPDLTRLEEEGEIMIVGAMYDISNGKVTFID
jgi:carbonic anhydrase